MHFSPDANQAFVFLEAFLWELVVGFKRHVSLFVAERPALKPILHSHTMSTRVISRKVRWARARWRSPSCRGEISLIITRGQELAKHKTWMAVDGGVYDLADFSDSHPGGPEILDQYMGADGSEGFNETHAHSQAARELLPSMQVGVLEGATAVRAPRARQLRSQIGYRRSRACRPVGTSVRTCSSRRATQE